MKKIRCAIYTRKSSEEGLEQDFNSLDAQYEACGAYILSQASEGWSHLPKRYDDGGLSGGTLERPALKQLLADVASGLIDIIVVYKVDRLTRSLLDFAKLVETFDKAGASFVSITQSFNTTTSMGRLTLNMLLSFAQFEREVTAERIRDKIAASKAKGMWMGGTPPLGYAPDGRTLQIVDGEAKLIRQIVERYLTQGNVRIVAEQLKRDGQRVPTRTNKSGRSLGGGWFTRGHLYAILSNPIYAGDIKHGEIIYAGLHKPIIDRDQWNEVQQRLKGNTRGQRTQSPSPTTSLLAGRLFDENGQPLVATHTSKKGKGGNARTRYRYYVSRDLQHGLRGDKTDGWRIPAQEIESLIAGHLSTLLGDPITLIQTLGLPMPAPDAIAALINSGKTWSQEPLKALKRVILYADRIEGEASINSIATILGLADPKDTDTYRFTIPVRLARSGVALKLVHSNGTAVVQSSSTQTLVKTIARGHRWWQMLRSGEITTSQLAAEEGVTNSYLNRILRLAFLDPHIIDTIIAGKHSASLDAKKLTLGIDLPVKWNDQRAVLGISTSQ